MPAPADVALVDTNVLVYALFPAAPQHAASRALIDSAQDAEAGLCVSPNVLTEFFSVVTDPRRVSPARSPEDALKAIDDLLALPGLSLIPVPVDVISRIADLVREHPVTDGAIFDMQIAATMLGNGVRRVYTFNRSDFEKVQGFDVLTP
jgi:predicted nucleic acid-binding protein